MLVGPNPSPLFIQLPLTFFSLSKMLYMLVIISVRCYQQNHSVLCEGGVASPRAVNPTLIHTFQYFTHHLSVVFIILDMASDYRLHDVSFIFVMLNMLKSSFNLAMHN